MSSTSKWSVVSASDALTRLEGRVNASFRRLVKHALRRDDLVLWCSGDWSRPRTPPHSDLAHVALVVVDGSLTTPKSLSLRYDDFVGGGFVARDDAAFLVLGAVEARDLFSVPDALGLFPAGLTVKRIASFEGGDSHVQIAHHLHAPLVVSGVGNGGAVLAAKTEVRLGAYARHLPKLPKGAATKHSSLEALLPFLADDGDDEWARIESLKGRKLPASFQLPALGTPRIVGGATNGASAKKAPANKLPAKKTSAKKPPAKKRA